MRVPVYIIAEAGVNHNGDRKLAFQLVDAAIQAGADAVKFQTFKAEELVTIGASKAEYQKKTTQANVSQYTMLKKLELSYEMHHQLVAYCKNYNIEFLSTAFDHSSLSFLVNELGLTKLKISSGDVTNGPLLLAHAVTDCNLILSTGMTTLAEIEDALGVLAWGLLNGKNNQTQPSAKAFQSAYQSEAGQEILKKKVTLLHCTTEYPAPLNEINLNAMATMRSTFGLPIGYSDHSDGITVPTAAAALGAQIIEKHFTLDRTLPGPDHQASLEPNELTAMIKAIRSVEVAMGNGLKEPTPSELKNRDIARKSLVSNGKIEVGEKFTEENIACKRPGTGISPMQYWEFLGRKATKHLDAEECL